MVQTPRAIYKKCTPGALARASEMRQADPCAAAIAAARPACYVCGRTPVPRSCAACKTGMCSERCMDLSWEPDHPHSKFCREVAGAVREFLIDPRVSGFLASRRETALLSAVGAKKRRPPKKEKGEEGEPAAKKPKADVKPEEARSLLDAYTLLVRIMMPNLPKDVFSVEDLVGMSELFMPIRTLVARVTRAHIANDPHYFANVCGMGCVRVARWVKDEYKLTTETIRKDESEALQRAAERGQVDMMRFLHDECGLGLEDASRVDLSRVAAAGHAGALAALVDVYGYCRDAPADRGRVLSAAAQAATADVLGVLRSKCGLTREEVVAEKNRVLREAAKGCRAGVLDFLADAFRLTDDDARAKGNRALHSALSYGCAAAMRVLHSKYGLGRADLEGFQGSQGIWHRPPQYAASRGYAEALKSLHDDYGLGRRDALGTMSAEDCIVLACGSDIADDASTAATLVELYDDYGMRAEDARKYGSRALRTAAELGKVETMRVLRRKYGLTKEDAKERSNWAMEKAAYGGREAAMIALHDEFGLGREEAAARKGNPLLAAASSGQAGIMRVLADPKYYGLTADDVRALPPARECHSVPSALYRAAKKGHAEALRVLRHVYGLTADDVRGTDGSRALLTIVARDGLADVLRVFVDDYGLTADDARRAGALEAAASSGKREALEVLRYRYGLTGDDLMTGHGSALAKILALPDESIVLVLQTFGITNIPLLSLVASKLGDMWLVSSSEGTLRKFREAFAPTDVQVVAAYGAIDRAEVEPALRDVMRLNFKSVFPEYLV